MTKVHFYPFMNNITHGSDREFFLSECASWLQLNIGQQGMEWWWDRDSFSGKIKSISVWRGSDATAFRLKFGL